MPDWPDGIARICLDEVDSTNSEAARLARAGHGPAWILAHRQTAGRGRRGRSWKAAGGGNFAASYLFRPSGPRHTWAEASFVAALALFDALKIAAPGGAFALKWPNDVLLAGSKISGILLESEGDALIVGIGVNLQTAPPDEPQAGALAQIAAPPLPEAFLDILAPAFARAYAAHAQNGFAQTRERWLSLATGLGAPIVARLPDAQHSGVFEGIDPSGALLLRKSEGELLVLPAADVYFGTKE